MTVGLIGPPKQSQACHAVVRNHFPGVDSFEEVASGSTPDSRQVRYWAKDNPHGLVLYCHTKGTHTPTMLNDAWRECMTRVVVGGWRTCTGALRHFSYDLAGTHWMDPGGTPLDPAAPYFSNTGGPAAGYLAELPELRQ